MSVSGSRKEENRTRIMRENGSRKDGRKKPQFSEHMIKILRTQSCINVSNRHHTDLELNTKIKWAHTGRKGEKMEEWIKCMECMYRHWGKETRGKNEKGWWRNEKGITKNDTGSLRETRFWIWIFNAVWKVCQTVLTYIEEWHFDRLWCCVQGSHLIFVHRMQPHATWNRIGLKFGRFLCKFIWLISFVCLTSTQDENIKKIVKYWWVDFYLKIFIIIFTNLYLYFI